MDTSPDISAGISQEPLAMTLRAPTAAVDTAVANSPKACFDEIYLREDPRGYYDVLGGLDYVIPELAAPVFLQIAQARAAQAEAGSEPEAILDLGCSYGINPAILRFGVRLDELRARYLRDDIAALPAPALIRRDRMYFASWPRRLPGQFIGIDRSLGAVTYARRSGLLDLGIVADLEQEPPPAELIAALPRVGMIISTGCVGYVGATTFSALLDGTDPGRPPWVVSFVLRMFDFAPIAGLLEQHGLVTEKLEGVTFVQRRMRDTAEQEGIVAAVRARGLSPEGLEADGFLHAELYVSRPHADVLAQPLPQLVSVISGRNRTGAMGVGAARPAGMVMPAALGER